jgi:hypothetical protein
MLFHESSEGWPPPAFLLSIIFASIFMAAVVSSLKP